MLPNFEDFYPASIVPMEENDRTAFLESLSNNKETAATHWLIALEGTPTDHGVYRWNVIVYPANATTVFYFDYVRFSSPPLYSFHEAALLAKEIEIQIKNDEFLTKKTLLLQTK